MTDDIEARARELGPELCGMREDAGRKEKGHVECFCSVKICICRARVVATLHAERERALREAAAIVGTLAETTFDNEPEFSAVMRCEAAILSLLEPPHAE